VQSTHSALFTLSPRPGARPHSRRHPTRPPPPANVTSFTPTTLKEASLASDSSWLVGCTLRWLGGLLCVSSRHVRRVLCAAEE
jgi:hypothetical protein